MNCILCQSERTDLFKVVKKPERSYFHCIDCDMIYMHPLERYTSQEEKARYDLHENNLSAGYVAFLQPLVEDLHKLCKESLKNSQIVKGLDYGCGPTAVASELMAIKGYQMTNYDMYFAPDQSYLNSKYKFILSTEVWEHFYYPHKEIHNLVDLLESGGLLGVMTSAHKGEAAFHDWHYRRDLTHVSFFSEKTFEWVAQKFGLRILKARSPYFILQKI